MVPMSILRCRCSVFMIVSVLVVDWYRCNRTASGTFPCQPLIPGKISVSQFFFSLNRKFHVETGNRSGPGARR